MMRRILYATDGSKSAEKAGRMVATIMHGFPDAELIVLYVTTELAYPYDFGTQDYMDAEKGHAEDIEADVRENILKDFAMRMRFRYEVGRPPISICEVAEEENVDLIVVGSHGHGAIDRLFLGSVSNAVLQRCKRPILVVKGE